MGNKNTNIKVIEKINNYKLIYQIKNERCITSFAVLRNNKIMLTFKGGIIKIFGFVENIDKKNLNKIELIEIINIEEEEYCFNYGIELQNGDLAVCSEDATLKIIKIILKKNEIKEIENKISNNSIEDNDNVNDNEKKKYIIIQKVNLGNDPIYIIKEFSNKELVLGCWNHILIFVKLPIINKYELINKIFINDRTFSLIELSPGEIVSSQCYSKTLTMYNMNNYEINTIKNIESNENPNIICKYNNQNDIIFVAYDKGINIVSIINKCLMQKIITKEIITSLCPFISHIKKKNKNEFFCLICGIKKRVYGQNVNYNYNFIQILFNLEEKNKIKINYINKKDEKNNKILDYKLSEKELVHYYDIASIENSLFLNNSILNVNKEDQMLISIGSEDKTLKIWELTKK